MSSTTAGRVFDGHRDIDGPIEMTPFRWGVCFAVIAMVHLGVAWIAILWPRSEEPAPPSPPAAIMIELAPMPVAPPTPPTEIAPGPKQEIAPAPPEPAVQPVLPPIPPSPAPKVDVQLPPPPKPKPRKPQERIVLHEPPKPRPDDKPPAPETTAPPEAQAPPASSVAAPAPGLASAPSVNAVPSWQGLLLGRLEQFKRYPNVAQLRHQQGVAYVRFAMDRKGRVLAATIDKSSGFDALDEETLALIHRAEPLPPPPPEVAGDPIELVVPVEFFLRK